MKFRAKILQSGKTATGIPVPQDVMDSLDAGKRPAVKVTLNDYTYRTTVGSMGGKSMLSLSAEHREAAGVRAGDTLEVTIEVDTEPRTVTVPGDLAAALAENGVQAAFDALSYSARKEFVRQVESAKAEATRHRRIAKIVTNLAED